MPALMDGRLETPCKPLMSVDEENGNQGDGGMAPCYIRRSPSKTGFIPVADQ